jgi:hypothetical protein
MSISYATMAMTGLNDPAKALTCVDEHALVWDAFADAKAALVARAEILQDHLDSSRCSYRMRSASGDHHYEVSIEYGPSSPDHALPFRTVFHVYESTAHGSIHGVHQ